MNKNLTDRQTALLNILLALPKTPYFVLNATVVDALEKRKLLSMKNGKVSITKEGAELLKNKK